jgi:hypothetical protein
VKIGARVRIVERPEPFRSSWVAAASGTEGTIVGPAEMRQCWDDPESERIGGYYWFEADRIVMGTQRWIVKEQEIETIPEGQDDGAARDQNRPLETGAD